MGVFLRGNRESHDPQDHGQDDSQQIQDDACGSQAAIRTLSAFGTESHACDGNHECDKGNYCRNKAENAQNNRNCAFLLKI